MLSVRPISQRFVCLERIFPPELVLTGTSQSSIIRRADSSENVDAGMLSRASARSAVLRRFIRFELRFRAMYQIASGGARLSNAA